MIYTSKKLENWNQKNGFASSSNLQNWKNYIFWNLEKYSFASCRKFLKWLKIHRKKWSRVEYKFSRTNANLQKKALHRVQTYKKNYFNQTGNYKNVSKNTILVKSKNIKDLQLELKLQYDSKSNRNSKLTTALKFDQKSTQWPNNPKYTPKRLNLKYITHNLLLWKIVKIDIKPHTRLKPKYRHSTSKNY